MDVAATSLSVTQQRVMVAVKRHGEATADELATTLEITPSAVRQHLSAMRAAGLVEARQVRGQHGQQGRPADRFRATAGTEPRFETPSGDVSIELLGDVAAEDPDLLDRVFEQRRRRQVAEARTQLADKPIDEQVGLITQLLDAQGFLADHEQVGDGHFRINLHNCPIWSVARRFRQACNAELELLRDLLPDATVQRLTHKTSGAHTCAYDIVLSTS